MTCCNRDLGNGFLAKAENVLHQQMTFPTGSWEAKAPQPKTPPQADVDRRFDIDSLGPGFHPVI